MEGLMPESPEHVSNNQENEELGPSNDLEDMNSTPIEVIEEKSDSDTHSGDDLSSNDEQNVIVNSNNSLFYENSDSKVDYAIKIDDNDTLSDIEDIKTDSASADSEDSALGSLPPDSAVPDREEEPQDRAEGSDPGIGSEVLEDIKLPNFNNALPSNGSNAIHKTENTKLNETPSTFNSNNNENIDNNKLEDIMGPRRSSLKRKHNQCYDNEPQTKKRKGIQFDNVTVYYFPRAQGFSCVPSQGGSTLGMEWEHSYIQKFSLTEHALEQKRLHKQILQQLRNERHSLQGASLSSSDDSDTEEETTDLSESELELDSYYFLQPVPTRQRRALLRAAGVRKIEGYEKDECRDIRTSREFCGCACKGTCNPETCSCSLGGIKCQVDRLNFPCGCTRDGCGNTSGRIEFNPVRVRTHFIHTLMRVGLEKKNEESREAVKRQWAEAQSMKTNLCTPNTSSYNRDQTRNQEEGLLKDVNLTPRVEVESCVNTGNFSNIHCDVSNTVSQNISQDGSYVFRDESCDRRGVNESMQYDNTNTHHNHIDPYTSNILQGKGPPYTSPAIAYNSPTMQRFPCNLNYAYEQQHNDNHHFKDAQSFSASSFEEFAHSSQMSMFNHYSHMYSHEYLHKPSTTMHDHNAVQYQNLPQNHYVYKNTTGCVNNEVKSDYNNLMTMPYQTSNKVQPIENDENWFSHNTLLNLDHNEQATQDGADAAAQPAGPSCEVNPDATENFGELIKKTMVESVTV